MPDGAEGSREAFKAGAVGLSVALEYLETIGGIDLSSAEVSFIKILIRGRSHGFITMGNMFLEGIDCRRLRRNNRSYQGAKGNKPDHFFFFHHRKMANAAVGHHAHALTDSVSHVHGDWFRRHDFPDRSVLRRLTLQADLPCIVSFGDYSD